MNIVFHTAMRRGAMAALVALAAFADVHAAAQDGQEEQGAQDAQTAQAGPTPAASETAAVREPVPVKINARKNAGDLSYKSFFSGQQLLQSFLPPEPRVIDFTYRLSFTELSPAARDEYVPATWAVAVVGDTFEQVVPVSRGGYFVLPELPQAIKENATVMFNAQTRWRSIEVDFKLRTSPQQTLAYADFARAIEEFKRVQGQIPWYRIGMRAIRNATTRGLRACFRTAGARIEIDGVAAPTRVQGMCHALAFEPSRANAGPASIGFVGDLDQVTLDAE